MTLFEHVGEFMVVKGVWDFMEVGLGFTLYNNRELDCTLFEFVFLNFHLYITNK